MVAGLETITAGEIAIGGRVVNNLEPKDRDIAMVFQNYALYPRMSAYDNMSYGLRIRGLSKEEIDSRVRKAAEILELKNFPDRKPRALSGGRRLPAVTDARAGKLSLRHQPANVQWFDPGRAHYFDSASGLRIEA